MFYLLFVKFEFYLTVMFGQKICFSNNKNVHTSVLTSTYILHYPMFYPCFSLLFHILTNESQQYLYYPHRPITYRNKSIYYSVCLEFGLQNQGFKCYGLGGVFFSLKTLYHTPIRIMYSERPIYLGSGKKKFGW